MRRHRLTGMILAGLALAGCGGQPAGSPAPSTSVATTADPVALIGLWRLEAPGEQADTVVRLAAFEFGLFRRCGALSGQWNADQSGSFVAHAPGFSPNDGAPGCQASQAPEDIPPMPAWLQRVVRYRVDGDDRLLLDARGDVVARLRPGARPVRMPDVMASELTDTPVVDAAARQRLAPAAPLPAGLKPATSEALQGTWIPAGRKPHPHVKPAAKLQSNGDWHGSDGCNGQGGRWAAGAGGAFVATMGPQTLIGCNGVSVGSWLTGARRAGFDKETLVLLDPAGKELGRLQRER